MKKEWIRINEEGFESYEEHQTFPENGFESDEKDSNQCMNFMFFQKVDSNPTKMDSNRCMNFMFFQKVDSNLPKGDSNQLEYF